MQESPKQQKHFHIKQIPALSEAYQVHQDLLKTINEMDSKIEEVIRTHEAQFLLAYRNHIKLMKQQLSLIKQRAEEQQKKMMSNERSLFLEKQIILFREEALKLYDKLEEKTQENQINKTQNRQLEKIKAILEKENKQLIKNAKLIETKNTLLNSEIGELKLQNATLKLQIERASEKNRHYPSKGATVNTINEADLFVNKVATPQRQSFMPMPLDSKKGSRNYYSKGKTSLGSKSLMAKEQKKGHEQILDHELKNYFLECLQTIRKQVAQRKVYGYKSEDINLIASWEDFRMIDKLRLLEMFMQNEKLLVWMYEKIFPNRMSQIENYFSNRKRLLGVDVRPKTKSLQINLDDIALPDGIAPTDTIKSELGEESSLPKVVTWSQKKKDNLKKYDIRSRIEIKSGKLSLKHLSDQKIE